MIGLRYCIFLLASCGGTTIAPRTLYRVGASRTHSFISFDHVNFLRSSREVHFKTDFFLSQVSCIPFPAPSKSGWSVIDANLLISMLQSLHLKKSLTCKEQCTGLANLVVITWDCFTGVVNSNLVLKDQVYISNFKERATKKIKSHYFIIIYSSWSVQY